jgi:hypothetical protein
LRGRTSLAFPSQLSSLTSLTAPPRNRTLSLGLEDRSATGTLAERSCC